MSGSCIRTEVDATFAAGRTAGRTFEATDGTIRSVAVSIISVSEDVPEYPSNNPVVPVVAIGEVPEIVVGASVFTSLLEDSLDFVVHGSL